MEQTTITYEMPGGGGSDVSDLLEAIIQENLRSVRECLRIPKAIPSQMQPQSLLTTMGLSADVVRSALLVAPDVRG